MSVIQFSDKKVALENIKHAASQLILDKELDHDIKVIAGLSLLDKQRLKNTMGIKAGTQF
jgi:hypothetical protein